MKDYTVQPGDTLPEIARRLYGDPHRWTDIADANGWLVQVEGVPTPSLWKRLGRRVERVLLRRITLDLPTGPPGLLFAGMVIKTPDPEELPEVPPGEIRPVEQP